MTDKHECLDQANELWEEINRLDRFVVKICRQIEDSEDKSLEETLNVFQSFSTIFGCLQIILRTFDGHTFGVKGFSGDFDAGVFGIEEAATEIHKAGKDK